MTNEKNITLSTEFVVAEGFVPFAWVVQDRPTLDTPATRRQYFIRGCRLFKEKLATFEDTPIAPTLAEERELIFMLQALIEAKHRLIA